MNVARATITIKLQFAPWVQAFIDAMQRIGAGGGDAFVAVVSKFVVDHGTELR